MAEGFLRNMAGDRFEVYSAGLKPSSVNPLAIKAMNGVGVDISTHTSDSLIDILPALKDGDSFVLQARELCYQQG